MTIQEREVLNEIYKIQGVLTTFKDGGDLMINIATQQQLNVILGKLKEAYPTVKYPLKIDSCSGCIRNFLSDLLPVFDRLNKQEKQLNQIEMVGGMFEIIENATDEEFTNATKEEVPEPTKVTTRRKGKK
ncbi:hypothetical protein [Sphingobacterium sp. 18053]|uniref:hypothetical protein n=1 Tax=Sphingobacterium sp. 18053 TaxID=2681401 RepID=UPI00135ABE30|nr:hypothetical protein [Sphingobacterium sp. 18053]